MESSIVWFFVASLTISVVVESKRDNIYQQKSQKSPKVIKVDIGILPDGKPEVETTVPPPKMAAGFIQNDPIDWKDDRFGDKRILRNKRSAKDDMMKRIGEAAEARRIQEMIRLVALYFRFHKFDDWDRRFENVENLDARSLRFVNNFPIPRVMHLDELVVAECDKGFTSCLNHIHSKVMRSLPTVRGGDDTTKDQLKECEKYTKQELKKHKLSKDQQNDLVGVLPFRNIMERFIFRASASYYLCWYTLEKTSFLKRFGKPCEQSDFRGKDNVDFQCALLFFCPDPCCGTKGYGFVKTAKECYQSSGNPCRDVGDGTCKVDMHTNKKFGDLLSHPRLDNTCDCQSVRKGFVFSRGHGICIDKDECYEGQYSCSEKQVCRNTPGSYFCTCPMGYRMNVRDKSCEKIDEFQEILGLGKIIKKKTEKIHEDEDDITFSSLLKTLGLKSTASVPYRKLDISREVVFSVGLALFSTWAATITAL